MAQAICVYVARSESSLRVRKLKCAETSVLSARDKASLSSGVSEYSRREIASWAGMDEQRVINVGNGVGDPFSVDGPRHEPGYPYLLYVGSHKPHKNLPRLLRAYAISGICQDVRLVMTGIPSRELSVIVDESRLSGSVSFVGTANNEALAQLYRGALGFVFPSLYEGFGLPPLEAMACGAPVLTSNVCSLPEVVGDAGILVNPMNVEEIAVGIRTLVEDSDTRAKLRENGLLRATRFSWTETARKTAEVLRMALANQTSSSRVLF